MPPSRKPLAEKKADSFRVLFHTADDMLAECAADGEAGEHSGSSFAAALGGDLEVPTLDGRVSLKIPPETQTGKVF